MKLKALTYAAAPFFSAFFKTSLVVLLCFFLSPTQAQDVFKTKDASMRITVVCSDSVLILNAKSVSVFLRTNTAKFIMLIDPSTFRTNNDSLNHLINTSQDNIITYIGHFDVEQINPSDITFLYFNVEGVLSTNNKTVRGKGHLDSYGADGGFSTLLSLKFNLSKDELGLDFSYLDLEDEIQIELVNVLLLK